VLLGPENLIGVQGLSNAERYGDSACRGSHDGTIGQGPPYLRFHSEQSRERDVQYAGVAVIPHNERHLEIFSRMEPIREFDVALAPRAGLAQQVEDLLLGRYQINCWNEHSASGKLFEQWSGPKSP